MAQKMTQVCGKELVYANRTTIEVALQELTGDDGLVIENIDCEDFLRKGDGCMGIHVAVEVRTSSKEKKEDFHLVVKTDFPNDTDIGKVTRKLGVYSKEIQTYKLLFPEMKRYAEQNGAQQLNLSIPRFVTGFIQDQKYPPWFIMNDLRYEGYKVASIRDGLDLDHCALVMEEFAKLHALSFAIKSTQGFDKFAFALNENMHSDAMHSLIGEMLYLSMYISLKMAAQGSQNESVVKKSKLFEPESSDHLMKLCQQLVAPKEPYATICMRDTTCRNMMFKYETVNGKPKPVCTKFFDFQMVVYQNPVIDLVGFLYTSTTRDTRKKHMGDLLRLYYNHFMAHVKQLKFHFPPYTYEQFHSHFRASKLYGVMFAMMILPFLIVDHESVPNLTANMPKDAFVRDTVDAIQNGGKFERISELFIEACEDELL